MAARNRRRNNKKKSLLSKSGVQENDATYLFLAEELHENITDLNMGSEEAPIEARENSIPAKEFKHLQKQALQKLEPIDEHEDGDDEFSLKLKSVTKCSGPITEADVQKLLLSYAFTSGLIQEDENENENESRGQLITTSSSSGSSLSTYFHAFLERCKKFFYNLSLRIIEKYRAVQDSLYEVFWIIIIYLNYWFPDVGHYMRYVNWKFSPNNATATLLTWTFISYPNPVSAQQPAAT